MEIHDYIADRAENLSEPMVLFFDKVVGSTRIISGDPNCFVHELVRRYHDKYSKINKIDPLSEMPDEMPRGSVFISYAHDDIDSVRKLIQGLHAIRVPVWIDKQRLEIGENYESQIKYAIKNSCSYFISVISRNTELNTARYVHKERQWAAERHVEGFVYYVPIIIDETPEPKSEPIVFSKVHFERLRNGDVSPSFCERMEILMEEYRISGKPRE
jgi:hypothetical protein